MSKMKRAAIELEELRTIASMQALTKNEQKRYEELILLEALPKRCEHCWYALTHPFGERRNEHLYPIVETASS